ncbi:transcriptional regulator [Mariniradius saccharolyticus AK6]|uniref:Transcriptional regulator n=1 Tax=Mariniradius saccharolyticus AK6 TaxID=1239962 RepID=M7YDP1_9BACT|nr:LytTR family DNA-binding domain-containing protein [Mariniradius saccharolyticus]EMS35271.1 transcriptional regulator [Mariniradius saccharolyticus AK6]
MKELLIEVKKNGNGHRRIEAVDQIKPLLISNGLFIRHKGNLVKIKWSDILWLKGDGNYTTMVTRNQVYSLRNILKEFESILPENEFFRIHKSYIVRLDEIVSINPREIVVGSDAVPVGRSYFQDLLQGIKKLGTNGAE